MFQIQFNLKVKVLMQYFIKICVLPWNRVSLIPDIVIDVYKYRMRTAPEIRNKATFSLNKPRLHSKTFVFVFQQSKHNKSFETLLMFLTDF